MKSQQYDFYFDPSSACQAWSSCINIDKLRCEIEEILTSMKGVVESVGGNCSTYFDDGFYRIALFAQYFDNLYVAYGTYLNSLLATDSEFALLFNFMFLSEGKVDEEWLFNASSDEVSEKFVEFMTIWSFCNAKQIPCDYLTYEDLEKGNTGLYLDVLEYVDVQQYLANEGVSPEKASNILCAKDLQAPYVYKNNFGDNYYYKDYLKKNKNNYDYIKHCRDVLAFCKSTPGVVLSKPGVNTLNDLSDPIKEQFLAWSSLNSSEIQMSILKCGYNNIHSWESLDFAINDVNGKIADINNKLVDLNVMYDEGAAIISFVGHIRNYYSYGCDYKRVEKEAKHFIIGYTYTNLDGKTFFSYDSPSYTDDSIDQTSIKPISLYDAYGDTQLYKDLIQKFNDNSCYFEDFFNGKDGLYNKAETITKERVNQFDALKKERDNLIEKKHTLEYIKTSIPEDTSNYFKMDFSYSFHDDYDKFSTENVESTDNVVENLTALFDITNYRSTDSPTDMYFMSNNKVNEKIILTERGGQNYLVINDSEVLADVLYAVVTENIIVEYDENAIRFHQPGADDNVFVNINSSNPLLKDFIKWAPSMTEGEKKAFLYNWNKNGAEAATKYLEDFSNVWDKRYVQEQELEDSQYAKDHPVLASIKSVLVTPAEGVMAAFNSFDALLQGETIRQSHVYSSGDVMRSAVASNCKTPVLSFLYSTGMSMADSAVLLAINAATGNTMAPFLSVALMGSRAYVSSLNDALDRGLSDGKAVFLAVSSAAAESVCEAASVGSLMNLDSTLNTVLDGFLSNINNPVLKSTCRVLGAAAIQGLNEGQEELCTEILNGLMDRIVSGDLSHYHLSIEQYVSDGYSIEEAIAMSSKENLKELGMAFLGGLVSGFANGGAFTFAGEVVSGVSNKIDVNNVVNNIMNEYNIKEFNLDEKNVRLNLRKGDYNGAISSIFDSSSVTFASQLVAANALYDSIAQNGEISKEQVNSIKTMLDTKLNEFLNLDLNEQAKQFSSLDSENQVYLYTKLDTDSFNNLFGHLNNDNQNQFLNNLNKHITNNNGVLNVNNSQDINNPADASDDSDVSWFEEEKILDNDDVVTMENNDNIIDIDKLTNLVNNNLSSFPFMVTVDVSGFRGNINVAGTELYIYKTEPQLNMVMNKIQGYDCTFWIVDENGNYIGYVKALQMGKKMINKTELEYFIDSSYRGKGYATECLKFIVNDIFSNGILNGIEYSNNSGSITGVTDINTISLSIADWNVGSQHVAEKCGFVNKGYDSYELQKDSFLNAGLLENNGVEANVNPELSMPKKMESMVDIAQYFGDSNLYLYGVMVDKIKNQTVNLSREERLTLGHCLYKNDSDIIQKMLTYLTPEELNTYSKLLSNKNNSIQGIWVDSLTESERFSVYNYAKNFGAIDADMALETYGYDSKGYSFVTINDLMRAGLEDGVPNLDSAIEKFGVLPTEIVTYRGAGLDALSSQFGEIDINNLDNLIGKIYTDKAYMSSTLLESKARAAIGKQTDVIFKITVPNDSNYGAYIESLAAVNYGQLEFLIKKNSTSIIENAYVNEKGKIVVEMRLFDDKLQNTDVVTDKMDVVDTNDDSDIEWFEEDEGLDDGEYELKEGESLNIGLQFFGGQSNNRDNSYFYDNIAHINQMAQHGEFYTFDVQNFDDIPSDFGSKINKPELLYFRKDGKLYTFDEVKSMNNSIINQNISNNIDVVKNQLLSGIKAMDNKYHKTIGLRSLAEYIRTGNLSLISSAGNFRETVRSLDRSTLVACYNMILDSQSNASLQQNFINKYSNFDFSKDFNLKELQQDILNSGMSLPEIFLISSIKQNFSELNQFQKLFSGITTEQLEKLILDEANVNWMSQLLSLRYNANFYIELIKSSSKSSQVISILKNINSNYFGEVVFKLEAFEHFDFSSIVSNIDDKNMLSKLFSVLNNSEIIFDLSDDKIIYLLENDSYLFNKYISNKNIFDFCKKIAFELDSSSVDSLLVSFVKNPNQALFDLLEKKYSNMDMKESNSLKSLRDDILSSGISLEWFSNLPSLNNVFSDSRSFNEIFSEIDESQLIALIIKENSSPYLGSLLGVKYDAYFYSKLLGYGSFSDCENILNNISTNYLRKTMSILARYNNSRFNSIISMLNESTLKQVLRRLDSETLLTQLTDSNADRIIKLGIFDNYLFENLRKIDLSSSDEVAKFLSTVDSSKKSYVIDKLVKNDFISTSVKYELYSKHGLYEFYDKKLVDAIGFVNGEMLDRIKKSFGAYVTDSKISRLPDVSHFMSDSEFRAKYGKDTNAAAMNGSDGSYMNLKYDILELNANVMHESLHELARHKYGTGFIFYKYGANGMYEGRMYNGLGEVATEYLAQLAMRETHPNVVYGGVHCGYDDGVLRLKKLVDNDILNVEQLKKAYFHNDISYIKNAIAELSDDATFDVMIDYFDKSIDDDAKIRDYALEQLDKIVTKLCVQKKKQKFMWWRK